MQSRRIEMGEASSLLGRERERERQTDERTDRQTVRQTDIEICMNFFLENPYGMNLLADLMRKLEDVIKVYVKYVMRRFTDLASTSIKLIVWFGDILMEINGIYSII
jgi:hypothetical protein